MIIFRRLDGSDARVWMAAAFLSAFMASACVVAAIGASERGIDDALLVTGRISFLLFWPAYAGSATVALLGSAFDVLKRQQRNFGLAFASAHSVHLGLVAWLCAIGAAPSIASFVVFGIAVGWTYLLAAASIGRIQTAIGRRRWHFINVVGLHYIAVAFAFDFMRIWPEPSPRYVLGYLPFVVLGIGGFGLRFCTWAARLIRTDSVNLLR